MKEITIPDIGDFKDVEVIEVLVKPGDRIEKETPLVTLETEKATMDVPSSDAGVVKSVALKKGDRVSKGTLILQVEESAEAAPAGDAKSEAAGQAKQPEPPAVAPASPPPEASSPKPKPAAPQAEPPTPEPAKPAPQALAERAASPAFPPTIDEPGFARAHAGPSVRKLARELGVDLGAVKGSGLKGRITHEDVKKWVKQRLSGAASAGAAPAPARSVLPQFTAEDFAKIGPVEAKPLGRIQKISGPRLHGSWTTIPHVWQMDEADITELEQKRNELKGKAAESGVKLTPLAFILRACVKALQEFPIVNSSLDAVNQQLVMKKYMHLGFAADTPNGLMVPVIHDADRKDVYEIARCLATLSEKARKGKLSALEMQGAGFTVSSLGGIGGTSFTPIINYPEVAILGVAKAAMKPVFKDGTFVPRLMLPFTFAYDHRVIDGALAVRFTTYLAERLQDVAGLLEAVP
jgi:pyruvate dehydrogenase E2 component (dihydrolipoamide acetyltransferase)